MVCVGWRSTGSHIEHGHAMGRRGLSDGKQTDVMPEIYGLCLRHTLPGFVPTEARETSEA